MSFQSSSIVYRCFNFLSLIYLLCNSFTLSAQTTIRGKLIDQKTKEPLAFAHVVVNAEHIGVMTDIDGVFKITHAHIDFLRCSYVGYKTLDYTIDEDQSDYLIQLVADNNELSMIELVARENPANKIIRKVITNKDVHNPENLESFYYQCYNKMIYDFIYEDSDIADSIQLKNNRFLEGGHMLMSESVTGRKYLKPDYSEETIKATRFSGIKNPTFTSLATDLQPFSFYDDIISFLDVHYLNPISKGSLNKYNFFLRDTLVNELDTTFVINYYPIKGKNFEGLKGLLYINTNGYAIENVIAEPYEPSKINLKIQQKYKVLNSGHWFPEQLNYTLKFEEYPSKDVQFFVDGKSYISHVELDLGYTRKDFSIDQVKLAEDAIKRDSTFWNSKRPFRLNTREIQTYNTMDSIGEKYKIDTYMKLSENLANGKIDFKHFELDVKDALDINMYEGLRLGLGIYTGETISKVFKLGGYFAYGFKDKKLKHGASLAVNMNKDKESQIKLIYRDDVQEFGTFHNKNLGRKVFTQRNLIVSEMNQLKQYTLAWKTRILKYLQTEFTLGQYQFTPQYLYLYKGNVLAPFNVSTAGINLRFAFKEKYIQTLNKRVSMGTKYPVISCVFNKSDKEVLGGDVSFTSLKLRAEYSRFWKNLGKTDMTLETGKIFNDVPGPLLFSGEGSLDDRIKLYVPHTFQTATPYEFLSDQFIHVFIKHNFGSLLFKTEKFKPQFSVVHNMGWSKLTNLENHDFEERKTDMSKGFIESGLIVDNILRVNYLNVGYLGFGAGVFGRYGAYAHEKSSDNLLYKISLIFTTR